MPQMNLTELHAHLTNQEHVFGLPPGTLLAIFTQSILPTLLQLLGQVGKNPAPPTVPPVTTGS